MDERLKRARDRFPNEVMVVYRHFPLGRIHPHAIRAAEASECAGLQGAFEEMNTALFRVQDSIGVVPWDLVAERAGVPDLAAFRECLARPDTAVSATVERDIADGKRLGVEGTPAVLLAGVRLRGAVPQETLDSLVTLAVAARRKRP